MWMDWLKWTSSIRCNSFMYLTFGPTQQTILTINKSTVTLACMILYLSKKTNKIGENRIEKKIRYFD